MTDEKLRWIAEAAGARMDELELCMQVYADGLTPSRAEGDRILAARYAFSLEQAREVEAEDRRRRLEKRLAERQKKVAKSRKR